MIIRRTSTVVVAVLFFALVLLAQKPTDPSKRPPAKQVVTGKDAFADYTEQKPGVRRKLTVADLPEPNQQESVENHPRLVPRPESAWPEAPAGFKVTLFAEIGR